MFEIQKSGDKTSSGEIRLDIRTHASPKVGQDQVTIPKYDQLIIERTIGLLLGPFTTLHRSFLKHCTLTNKAFGTI